MDREDMERDISTAQLSVPGLEFVEAHRELDDIEQQLESIRRQQESIVDLTFVGDIDIPPPAKGEVHHVDLRSLIDLEAADEEFDRRFDLFANGDLKETRDAIFGA